LLSKNSFLSGAAYNIGVTQTVLPNMKRSFVLFVLLLLPLYVHAQSLDAKLADIDAYAQKVMDTWHGPGMAIAVVKDDKVVFAQGYGVRELGKPDRVDENTLFEIASNSKAFTTAALAILVDQNKLKWDDKVSKYLPDFRLYDPWVSSELTVRDLVSHRVGLGTFSGDLLWYHTDFTTDDILRRARFLKPVRGFRAGYGYQNIMFIAAGRVVEKASGQPWAEFVREHILNPLGMNRTTTLVADMKDNFAVPHNESGGKLRSLGMGHYENGTGAVRINSSVADLSKWIRLQLGRGTFEGKTIFTADRSREMWQPNIMIPVSDASTKLYPTKHFSAYGMGWFLSDYQGRKIMDHSGGLDGMLSYTVLIPEENAGFVVLTNNESPSFYVMRNKILDVLTGAPAHDWNADAIDLDKKNKADAAAEDAKSDASRVPNTKPSLPLSGYAGTYSDNYYGDVTVTEENGKIVLRMTHTPDYVADLDHWHYDTFRIHWRPTVGYNFPRGFVTFTIDKDGKTDALKIDQPNNDLWFYELDLHRTK
jgi:CubicO group peptidase (beta-lactamase class C family)